MRELLDKTISELVSANVTIEKILVSLSLWKEIKDSVEIIQAQGAMKYSGHLVQVIISMQNNFIIRFRAQGSLLFEERAY